MNLLKVNVIDKLSQIPDMNFWDAMSKYLREYSDLLTTAILVVIFCLIVIVARMLIRRKPRKKVKHMLKLMDTGMKLVARSNYIYEFDHDYEQNNNKYDCYIDLLPNKYCEPFRLDNFSKADHDMLYGKHSKRLYTCDQVAIRRTLKAYLSRDRQVIAPILLCLSLLSLVVFYDAYTHIYGFMHSVHLTTSNYEEYTEDRKSYWKDGNDYIYVLKDSPVINDMERSNSVIFEDQHNHVLNKFSSKTNSKLKNKLELEDDYNKQDIDTVTLSDLSKEEAVDSFVKSKQRKHPSRVNTIVSVEKKGNDVKITYLPDSI